MPGEIILIVDDDERSIELTRDVLEAHGYLVYSATTGHDALKLAREIQPDLILMDIRIPGMDGLDVTRALQDDKATRQIPVVALTACALIGNENDVFAAGCIGYITKPIDTHRFPLDVARYLKMTAESH